MTDTPNPALLQVFGTEAFWHGNLEKTASPLAQAALRVGAPAAFMGLMAYQQHREAKQLLEAQILTEMFRHAEAGRMAPVQAGFRGQGPMFSDMGNAAANLRQMAAYEAMMRLKYSSVRAMRENLSEELEKQALSFAPVGGAVMGALGRAGKALGYRTGAARGAAQGATQMAPAARVLPKPPRPPVRPQAVGPAVDAGPAQGLFGRPVERPGGALTAPAVPSRGAPRPPPSPAATTGAAPGTRPSPAPGKPLWPSIRNKALLYGGGTAALGGAGYVGYKGLQTAKDYMMQPSYMSTSWGPPGMMPQGGVNQYGYQDVYY